MEKEKVSSPDWELLDVPMILQHKKNDKNNSVPVINDSAKEEEKLCGYLSKYGAKGLIKGWKMRWFVYNSRSCSLHYYRRPQDTEPLGSIDVSNATFTFSPDELTTFQINTPDREYSLQAQDHPTVLFWLQELQARRLEYTKNSDVNRSPNTTRPLSGLLKNQVETPENEYLKSSEFTGYFNSPVERPPSFGQETLPQAQDSKLSLNFSFTNLSKEFKNWRKSTFFQAVGEPLKFSSGDRKNIPPLTEESNEQSTSHAYFHEKQQPNLIDISDDFDDSEKVDSAEKNYEMVDQLLQVLQQTAENEHTKKMKNLLVGWKENLKVELEKSRDSREEYIEKENVWKEIIRSKDEAIVNLTNKLTLYESEEKPVEVYEADEKDFLGLNKSTDSKTAYAELQETCNAIKSQNKFLNGEILELVRLRKIDYENLKKMTIDNEKMEAKYLKLKSRYLCLLKEYTTPREDSGEGSILTSDIVEHLIDDAINEDNNNETGKPIRYCDKYGFYDLYDKEDDESLDNIVEYLDALADNKQDGSEKVSVAVKWENFFITQGTSPLTKTAELKMLIRFGVPHEFRARVWNDLINLRINSERLLFGPGYYAQLLANKQGTYSPSAKQIELDLLRTLPNNKYYDKIDSHGIAQLRRILLAYSWHNPAIGYCQGLNRLGAIALLYLDEESSFWALVCIIEHLMPTDYYSRTLIGAQIDQKVLRDLIDEKMPKLGAHLNTIRLDTSLISFNWFLTMFVDVFPIELTLRVWDTCFFEGSKVLFRFSLATFKIFEEELMKLDEGGKIFQFFRKVPKSKFNISKILQVAFIQLNPFGRRNIEMKRKIYRPQLQAQLDEFENLRHEYHVRKTSVKPQVESEEET